ncbi:MULTISPECIES: ferric reductase-like transmembrane domain-containing protein [unclassified Campylobacter]|uniref:ferric reductase-like transmembrane domain-containing protein n=1 Tax=unclassified Campylobacter TaxID=2593542 RepID=UPI001237F2EC|nr:MULTISPECIES: ferric reductase-like transmembrane domain-containing protein [unclassified Campylobacter]KAA6226449.1 sulfite oxidase heme-binding subunit YedZ [Campylobacter sp. LR185c]KAA6228585.1 sulfite oxidase heme-binding subunit YedZ [Campylobacter sp. LR196d]KAA6229138.1 sulfite oxidase heme-binding subunit YedZ [Campylobacter sp. LR286c]KAA6233929.1 sulfite oxidase heme-binding subunit YedZ [Campylobacter sp. LR291e]KAA6234168.1 sulfite oxidase heme-binding subunit YedZ [Campylobact
MKIAYFLFILCILISLSCIVYNVLFSTDLIIILYKSTGFSSLFFLNLSLICALISSKKIKVNFNISRAFVRIFGIYSFVFIFFHFLIYFVLSKNLSFVKFFNDISSKGLEFSGFVAFVMMFLMFLSSFKYFKILQKIQKLGYICLLVSSFHIILANEKIEILEALILILSLFYLYKRYKNLKIFKYNVKNDDF